MNAQLELMSARHLGPPRIPGATSVGALCGRCRRGWPIRPGQRCGLCGRRRSRHDGGRDGETR